MKLKTHIATGLLAAQILIPPDIDVMTSLYLLFAIYMLNIILDRLGHSYSFYKGRLFPKRNKLHSPIGTFLLSTIISIPVITSFKDPYIFFIILIAGYIHLLEDIITEGGIYIRGTRVKLFMISYNSRTANTLTVLIFLILSLTNCYYNIGHSYSLYNVNVSIGWLLFTAFAYIYSLSALV